MFERTGWKRASVLAGMVLAAGLVTTALAQDAEPPAAPESQPIPEANEAMVRFLHAAPNAEVDGLVLVGEAGNVEPEAFTGLSYGQITDYVAVPLGDYEVSIALTSVEGEEAGTAIAQGERLAPFAGEYYTIALIGLVDPGDEEQEDTGGFFGWLQGLFTGDDDSFAMRTMVINDAVTTGVTQDEAEIRIAHLAPGVEELALVGVQEDGEVVEVHTVTYGNVSGFGAIQPPAASMELRVAGSEAVVFDLADLEVSTGLSHTLYVIGTPVEQVPLDVILVSNPQALPGMIAAGTAVPPGAATFDASQVALLRNNLIEIEAYLESIEARLANLGQLEGGQEEAAAAQQELEAVRELVFTAREQIEAQPAIPAATPAVPADPAAPAEPADDEAPAGEDDSDEG